MSYALSLMRTYSNEHRDFTPHIDLAALKHVAYVFDGLMFYLRLFSASSQTTSTTIKTQRSVVKRVKRRRRNDENSSSSDEEQLLNNDEEEEEVVDESEEMATDEVVVEAGNNDEEEEEDDDYQPVRSGSDNSSGTATLTLRPALRTSPFFRRSSSTVCLGGRSPDPFQSALNESLPLATKPHLLHPFSRVHDLFKPAFSAKQRQDYSSLRKIGLMSSNLRNYAPVFHSSASSSSLASTSSAQSNTNSSTTTSNT